METQRTQVLLIDDSEDDYVITRDLLEDVKGVSFNLDWAPTYEDALEIINNKEHDVYFIDYYLGERTGLEILSELIQNGCKTPIIFLTGQGNHEVDLEAMKIGASDYLVKGEIDSFILERSIRYAIERKLTEEALILAKNKYYNIFQQRL